MRIKINLLPPEIQAESQAKRKQKISGFVGAGILFLLLGVYLALFIANQNLEQQRDALQQEKQSYQQQIAHYKKYQDLKARTDKANQLVQDLTQSSPDFIMLLEGISQTVPYDVWLTELVTTSPKKETKEEGKTPKQTVALEEVTLRGNALEHAAVANWLHELPEVSTLSNIRLQTTNEEDPNGQPIIEFEIKAALKAGNGKPPVEKAGGQK